MYKIDEVENWIKQTLNNLQKEKNVLGSENKIKTIIFFNWKLDFKLNDDIYLWNIEIVDFLLSNFEIIKIGDEKFYQIKQKNNYFKSFYNKMYRDLLYYKNYLPTYYKLNDGILTYYKHNWTFEQIIKKFQNVYFDEKNEENPATLKIVNEKDLYKLYFVTENGQEIKFVTLKNETGYKDLVYVLLIIGFLDFNSFITHYDFEKKVNIIDINSLIRLSNVNTYRQHIFDQMKKIPVYIMNTFKNNFPIHFIEYLWYIFVLLTNSLIQDQYIKLINSPKSLEMEDLFIRRFKINKDDIKDSNFYRYIFSLNKEEKNDAGDYYLGLYLHAFRSEIENLRSKTFLDPNLNQTNFEFIIKAWLKDEESGSNLLAQTIFYKLINEWKQISNRLKESIIKLLAFDERVIKFIHDYKDKRIKWVGLDIFYKNEFQLYDFIFDKKNFVKVMYTLKNGINFSDREIEFINKNPNRRYYFIIKNFVFTNILPNELFDLLDSDGDYFFVNIITKLDNLKFYCINGGRVDTFNKLVKIK